MVVQKITRIVLAVIAGLVLAGSAFAEEAAPKPEIVLRYTFDKGAQGWLPAFSDYSQSAKALQFNAEIRTFPEEWNSDLKAYYLQSHNTPDDLFMYLKKELGEAEGVEPNQAYSVSMTVGLLSNAAGGGIGVGGSEGDSVYLKAGLSLLEPVPVLDGQGHVRLSADKGDQAGSGREIQVVDTVANGLGPDDPRRYVYLEKTHHLPELVRTDERGVLWATVGTESGFEGLTGLYYYQIVITLRPI